MASHGSNQRKDGQSRKAWTAILLLPLLAGGCVYSVHPWYGEGEGHVAPQLAGAWRDVDGDDSWIFLARGDSLRVLCREEGRSVEFVAVDFAAGGVRFLDLTPAPGPWSEGPQAWYLLPLHGLHRWSLADDTLRLATLDPQSLETVLAEGGHPALERQENRWVFLGPREEMAAFLTSHLLDEALYSESTVLVRE